MLKTRLKEYRIKAGLNQAELANLVNVRRETIGHLERGEYNPSFKLAFDIARVLEVDITVLFWYEKETT